MADLQHTHEDDAYHPECDACFYAHHGTLEVVDADDMSYAEDVRDGDVSLPRTLRWRRSPDADFMFEISGQEEDGSWSDWSQLEGVWHGLFVGAYVKDPTDVVGVIQRLEVEDTDNRVGIETILVRFGADDFQECYLENLRELRTVEED